MTLFHLLPSKLSSKTSTRPFGFTTRHLILIRLETLPTITLLISLSTMAELELFLSSLRSTMAEIPSNSTPLFSGSEQSSEAVSDSTLLISSEELSGTGLGHIPSTSEEDLSHGSTSGTTSEPKSNNMAEEGGNYLAVAESVAAETTECLKQARTSHDYLSGLPSNVLNQIIHHVYRGELLVVDGKEKDHTKTTFSKGEHCQLLLTCKTIHDAAKPIFYSQIKFCFRDLDGLNRFTTIKTGIDYQRVFLVQYADLAHLQLQPVFGEKHPFPNLVHCGVIPTDIDDKYDGEWEDEERSANQHSSSYREGWW